MVPCSSGVHREGDAHFLDGQLRCRLARRQLVLVLSGGIAMTYGSGQQSAVTAGQFLVGEDTDGQGHISRAVAGEPRFSIFAHLA